MSDGNETMPPCAGANEVLLAELAEEFTARLRGGEDVSVGDFAARHPHLGPELLRTLVVRQSSIDGSVEDSLRECGGGVGGSAEFLL